MPDALAAASIDAPSRYAVSTVITVSTDCVVPPMQSDPMQDLHRPAPHRCPPIAMSVPGRFAPVRNLAPALAPLEFVHWRGWSRFGRALRGIPRSGLLCRPCEVE